MIQLNVVNKGLQVGSIRITSVAGASVVLVGDTEVIAASSVFDTPPEPPVIGPLVPFAPESGGQ